ncbi:hypothetical protein [Paraburkholderia bannensis]|uniref:hypothetical protein n=1 Tax=Paraburkholderia bannensis TaxID=765414 RepID=UPI002AC35A2F|nr:hypothetical protein [Paraburkholderia bannensis]
MSESYEFAREHAREIARIVQDHQFRSPAVIDEADSDFDLTLLITPVGEPTLFDMGAIMSEFEDRWNKKVQLVTPETLDTDEPHTIRNLEIV